MKLYDGGAAYPISGFIDPYRGDVTQPEPGMSLRDWFAGQALMGMLAHSTRYKPAPGYPKNWHEAISQEAYELSDTMLKAREVEPCK